MKKLFLALLCIASAQLLWAQEDSTGERSGFRKENLFAGGSISFGFGDNFFQIGGNPMIGYSLTKWADVGLGLTYAYSSQKDYYYSNAQLQEHLYGGGPFVRLHPVRFLFAHGQLEHNFISFKAKPFNGGETYKENYSATSFLVGAGYSTGRHPGSGGAWGYFSILWDVMDDANSPYISSDGSKQAILRAGLVVPLFQGKSRDW